MKPMLNALLMVLLTLPLVYCGGGGGSSTPAAPAESPDNGLSMSETVAATAPATVRPVLYQQSPTLLPIITAAGFNSQGQPVVRFQVTDESFNAILDLTANDFRVTIAKLQSSPIGNFTGSWQSYINRIEQPGVGPGLLPKLQATYERATAGTFTNNGDGTYQYIFQASVLDIDDDIQQQAESEGLNLSFSIRRTHRIAMQFDNALPTANPYFDWVPSTGRTTNIFQYQVTATESCNTCHDKLAIHGGGRTDVEYCVTCHNPGSTDANSGNSVDFAEMVHKIHRGAELPSVVAGGSYQIYGFRDSLHDYSNVHLPRDIRDCQICHAGTGTDQGLTERLTLQGDNWAQYASQKACGSCHDDVDFSEHYGGQVDDSNCMSCHSVQGIAGTIANSHDLELRQAQAQFEAQIRNITQTGQGEFPVVTFAIVNPEQSNTPYNILTDEAFGSGARIALTLSWSTQDFNNIGSGGINANSVSVDALANAVDIGNGEFQLTFTTAIPDGTAAPFIAAEGSGAITIEGRVLVEGERVPLTNSIEFFSINESSGSAQSRREIVDLNQCHNCHGTLSLHGGNRTDNIDGCATCHNPRNTDIVRRPGATTPPTDGKAEQSVDFKILIHGIHAAAMLENPLQVVGFGGTVHVFDTDTVHYPGLLNQCTSCHVDGSYRLPLNSNVLGTTIDTGDVSTPLDDVVVSPQSAVCASCHDGVAAQAHMEANGGNFATSQSDIDSGAVLEQCEICHGSGRVYGVDEVHNLQ